MQKNNHNTSKWATRQKLPNTENPKQLSFITKAALVCVCASLCTSVVHNHIHIYTVNHKKRDSLFFTITLANLYRFLYHFNREEILHATVVKFTTSP